MNSLELAEKYVTSTNVSVFLTGKAGTGKTTFLHHIVQTVRKRSVVLAPTGVAAVNAAGVTIHSFFQLPLCPYLPDVKDLVTEYQMPDKFKSLRKEKVKLIRTLDLIIIDEISMVRADLLDAVDMTLRRYRRSSRPFGGVQLLMIGDVQQLPPVVTEEERPYIEQVYPSPFFFHSKALQQTHYVTIELSHIFRQQDEKFIGLLNNIRDNRFDRATLDALNARWQPNFNPPDSEGYIRLTTHNWQANEVNQRKLNQLDGNPIELKASVDGNFPETSFPTDGNLVVKKGAQVMFVKNDSGGAYYNGKIATVEGYDPDAGVAVVDKEGNHIVVGRERWENIKYEIDPADNQIKQKVDGSFVQYPLRLAWAITIHKSQGLTFDRVVIDAASAFTYGQVYVALSRCRTLEGVVLATPISANCAFDNEDVLRFSNAFPSSDAVEGELHSFQSSYFYELLFELFDISALYNVAERLNRLYQRDVRRLFPALAEKMRNLLDVQIVGLADVAERFRKQLTNIRLQSGGDIANALLVERIGKGVEYFAAQFDKMLLTLAPILEIEVNNKDVAADFDELSVELRDAIGLKQLCFKRVGENGFSTAVYNQAKVDFILGKEKKKESKRNIYKSRYTKKKEPKPKKPPVWTETVRLFAEGRSLEEIARERKVTVSTIASHIQKAYEAGVVTIDKILTEAELEEIMEYIVENNPQSSTEIYEHFGGKYQYHQIRAAMHESKELL